jgi:hypothetical protein
MVLAEREVVAEFPEILPPTGWTLVAEEISDLSATTDHGHHVWMRRSDGTDGATVNVSQSYVNRRLCAITWAIHAGTWHDTGTLTDAVFWAPAFAETENTDKLASPALTPSAGVQDYLWAVTSTMNGNRTMDVWPSGYALDISTNTDRDSVAVAWKTERTASQTPGQFDWSGTGDILCQTLAIRGIPSGGGLFFGAGF